MCDKLSKGELDYFNKQTSQSFKDQAIFFLNAYWDKHQKDAEKIWDMVKTCKDFDKQYWNALPENKKGDGYKEGTQLDEFWSHKLLESYGRPMSIVEFRNEYKKIDVNFDKHMSLLELCIYWFGASVEHLANYVPGAAQELRIAQKKLDEVETAFKAAQSALDQASKTESEAKKTKTAAVASAQEAEKKAAEATKKAAEAAASEQELKAALSDLKAKEDAYAAKTEELKKKADSGAGVAAMRAKNELSQHLAEDPLPLRQAKLKTEAATKKAEKARVAADQTRQISEEAAKKAEIAKDEAEVAADVAEKARLTAEDAVKEGEERLREAEEFLAEAKKKGGGETLGTFWWLDRELQERKKYMPKSGNAKLLF